MDDRRVSRVEEIREFLKTTKKAAFKGLSRGDKYAWIEEVVKRFKYFELRKKERGLVKAYLRRMSGFSCAQMTRLISRLGRGEKLIDKSAARRNSFAEKYTKKDRELLAATDNAHGRLSGPATKALFERQYEVFKDERFSRLKDISSSHIYNLRGNRSYLMRAKTFSKTRAASSAIGIRRRPEPQGLPGQVRVDSVHQGDKDKEKGVYHINLVDEVLQWEIVLCVEKISEAYLLPMLEEALLSFPVIVLGFHSDNGSEYINGKVAKLLNKLLIEQTKSRSGRSGDNALVEGKNGSVIRKHMGYWHIEQKYAPLINEFYREHFNDYLNFHRPCGFATVTMDGRGKWRRKYETYQTPYERLKFVDPKGKCLREGVSFKSLDEKAFKRSDNEAADEMQRAKERLFRRVVERRVYPLIHNPFTERKKEAKKERPAAYEFLGSKSLKKEACFQKSRRNHDDTFQAHSRIGKCSWHAEPF